MPEPSSEPLKHLARYAQHPEPREPGREASGEEVLERLFEAMSRSVDAAGKAQAEAFLARLALLLAQEAGDPERVMALIAAARISA